LGTGGAEAVLGAIAGRERLSRLIGDTVAVRLMLATVLVAIACLFYLAQASQVSVVELNIGYLQTEGAHLNVENANLHASAAGYQSLPRISSEALNKLHMVQPDMAQTVWVRSVVPQIIVPRDAGREVKDAMTRSQPLAWMHRFVSLVRASL
jgi:cell division protein FtsL